VGITQGGADGAMAQEDLQDADVGAGLQQMGGKAVAQGVHGDLLRQTRLPDDLPQNLAHCCGSDMTLRFLTREQILSFRPNFLVVLAKQGQEALSQNDIAILLALPRTDMNAPPLAVNIGDPQSAYFGNPETSRISSGHDGFVLHRTDGRKDSENLLRTENDRESLRPFGVGNLLYGLGSFESDVVEEFEGVDVHAQRCRRGFTIPDQMEEEAANLLLPHLFGGPQVVAGEMACAAQVCTLRVRAVGLEEQIPFHPVV